MRSETINGHQRVILDPGDYYATESLCTISTLLGSCVAACLYDPVHRVMGMNHFMLSNRRYSRDLPMTRSEAGRYGIHAMELLINAMLKLGAQKSLIKAKAFGGGSMTKGVSNPSSLLVVGEVNCRFIREFLASEEIPLVAENLGGQDGRVIHFSPGDYSVYVRSIKGARQTGTIARRDRQCWLRAIEEHEQSQMNVDLWL